MLDVKNGEHKAMAGTESMADSGVIDLTRFQGNTDVKAATNQPK